MSTNWNAWVPYIDITKQKILFDSWLALMFVKTSFLFLCVFVKTAVLHAAIRDILRLSELMLDVWLLKKGYIRNYIFVLIQNNFSRNVRFSRKYGETLVVDHYPSPKILRLYIS